MAGHAEGQGIALGNFLPQLLGQFLTEVLSAGLIVGVGPKQTDLVHAAKPLFDIVLDGVDHHLPALPGV